jgi:hypothetical protein
MEMSRDFFVPPSVRGRRFGRDRRRGSGHRPPADRAKALADVSDQPGSLSQIEHVVVFMQENRSFDTYFGSLRGVRGFDDPTAITLPTGKKVWYQPDPKNPDGYELPFHLDTQPEGLQQDRVLPELRRERRVLRPRAAADPAARDSR